MRSKVRQNKFGENGYCRNCFIKKSFCHTFPAIPKAQNECMKVQRMYGDQKYIKAQRMYGDQKSNI